MPPSAEIEVPDQPAPVANVVIPQGNFKFVAIALDMTGKKLIDEICHIAVYHSAEKTFSQYIMPHRDMSRSATRTHGIRIFTNFGKYRVLKDLKNHQTLRTKSEYSALTDLIAFLGEVKGESDGVVLAYHDNNKGNLTPFLMDALDRYKMTDDFYAVVKGFVSCASAGAEQPDIKGRSVTLRSMARRLLGEEDPKMTLMQNAKSRAEITFKLMLKLSGSETEEVPLQSFNNSYSSRDSEIEKLKHQRELAEKVKSLRPIFVNKIRKGPKDRSRAVLLRRFLIEQELDIETLKSTFLEFKKEGICKIVEETGAKKKKQDVEELVEMITKFFEGGEKVAPREKSRSKKEKGQGEAKNAKTSVSTESASSTAESEEEQFEEAKSGEEVDTAPMTIPTQVTVPIIAAN